MSSAHLVVARQEDILERAVRTVADQAKNASAIVDDAHNAGLDGSYPVTLTLLAKICGSNS